MKKLLLFLLVFIPIISNANPVWYGVSISEIYFNDLGEWTLEIDNVNITSVELMDSLFLKCNSGSAKIIMFDTTDYIVITNDNLSNAISLDKIADCIKLYSYAYGEYKTDSVCIGEISGSYIKNVVNGQSVARLWGYGPFYKDNSPTIGSENDLDGSKGKIYGHFHDTAGEPIGNKYFFINEGYATTILQEQGYAGNIEIDENGFYCAEITSRNYTINKRAIYESSTNYVLMQFDTVSFELNENDSINIDFVRTLTSIKTVNQNKVLLSNYPNPASDYTYFIFDSEGIETKGLLISIYNTNGQKIDSFVPESSQYFRNTSNLLQGTYFYTLSLNNQIIGSNKLQIIK